MKRIGNLYLLILALLCVQLAEAQKNVIKTRPLRTIYTSALPITPIQLNLTYERVIIPKLSAAVTLNYGLERDLSGVTEFLELDTVLQNPKASSFSFSPEVRFYPGLKDTPRGFYLMGEFFYNSTNFNTDYALTYSSPFTLPDGSIYEYDYKNGYNIDGQITSLGGGIGIGSQWIFGKHFSVDILWFGIGFGTQRHTYEVDGALIDQETIIQDLAAEQGVFTEDQIRAAFDNTEVPTWQDIDAQFGQDVKETASDFGVDLESDVRTDGITASFTGLAIRPRFLNISIGFAF